jgi:FAD/FMN-containing dehydrogenase
MAISKERLYELLCGIVGSEYVASDVEIVISYSRDQHWRFVPPQMPDFVVYPSNTEEVRQIAKLANMHRVPLIPRATGVNMRGLCTPTYGGIIIDFRRMKKIEIDPDNLAAIIEPGVTMGELVRECLKYDLKPGVCGAAHSISPLANYMLRGHYWNTGEFDYANYITSMEIVLADGELLYTGSWALPDTPPYWRSVFGADLTGLFQNQPGNLGIITKAAIRLFQVPEKSEWVIAGYNDQHECVRVFREIARRRIPTSLWKLNWVSYSGFLCDDVDYRKEFKGAFGDWLMWCVIEDPTGKVVDAKAEKALEIVRESDYVFGGERFPLPEDVLKETLYPVDMDKFGFREGYYYAIGCFHSVSRDPEMYEVFQNLWTGQGLDPDLTGFATVSYYPFTGQSTYTEIEAHFSSTDDETVEKVKKVSDAYVREMLHRGIAYGWFRPYGWAMKHTLPRMGKAAEVLKHLKDYFDPNGILNPGKCYYW